jgi:hypothetical protein
MPEARKEAASSGELYEAVLAVQDAAPKLPKDATNPHFKSNYTPLDTIVEKIGPLLVKHGLVWTTRPCLTEGQPGLHYSLTHAASGESLEGTMPLLLTKQDPQGMGSALTYARRYSICSVLNLVGDEDDDGSAGSRPAGPKYGQAVDDPKPGSAALAFLIGPEAEGVWKEIVNGCDGYMPQAVADAIRLVARTRKQLDEGDTGDQGGGGDE